jgi:folate-binding protein YgfZ
LFEHLDRYIIADDVTLVDRTGRMATIAVEGPEAANVLSKLGAPIPATEYGSAAWGERVVARLSSTGSNGFFVFTTTEDEPALVALLAVAGAVPATAEDAHVVRLEHGKPRYGEEITERFLVQETGLLHAVHFSKGCYLGQEIVERVRSRAQIHRLLRKLEIATDQPPAPGTKFKVGDADAAEIVSAAYSPALEKTVAMAYVRVPHSEPGTELALGDVKARVVS